MQLDFNTFPINHWYSLLFDMYMSYRWRESFNTVIRQIRDVITTGIDMCERRMRKGGGGGWTIHPSRRWLISCVRAAVLYVCLSIALTSCTTSMAETNLDAIRKQKRTRNILKDIDWNEKLKCNSKRPQLQKLNQKNYKYSFCLMVQASDHVYVLPRTYTCHTDLPAKNITGT